MRHPNYQIQAGLDLFTLTSIIGHLQLALRHPGTTGPSARLVRQFIDAAIDRVESDGLIHTAELLRKGDDPASDR